jgi:hypothetical protein
MTDSMAGELERYDATLSRSWAISLRNGEHFVFLSSQVQILMMRSVGSSGMLDLENDGLC